MVGVQAIIALHFVREALRRSLRLMGLKGNQSGHTIGLVSALENLGGESHTFPAGQHASSLFLRTLGEATIELEVGHGGKTTSTIRERRRRRWCQERR